MNRHRTMTDSTPCNFERACALCPPPQQRIAVVGSGNTDVGNANPTRKPGQPVVDNLSGSDGSKPRIDPPLHTERQERVQAKTSEHPVSPCGAMSQQGSGVLGNISAPQKFVR